MTSLFVDRTGNIEVPAAKVWTVLTDPAYTQQWAAEFALGAPFFIESTWDLGSSVVWKNEQGEVIVEGEVTAVELNKLLRFTVFDVRAERPEVAAEDGITLELTGHDGASTKLHVRQGDFSALVDGQKYRDMTDETWSRVLPKIKTLAESPS